MANYYVYKMEIYMHTTYGIMNKYEDFIYVSMKKNISCFHYRTNRSFSRSRSSSRERERSELKIIYGFAVAAHGACPRHDALISMTSDLPICLAIYIYIVRYKRLNGSFYGPSRNLHK